MTSKVRQTDRAASLEDIKLEPNKTLVIGDLARWTAEGRMTSGLSDFTFVDLAGLTVATMQSHAPDIILSPLFGDTFDAVDVAVRLHELGFDGCYRAISDNLPNADIVRKEVRTHAPDLDFDLLLMPAQTVGAQTIAASNQP